MVTALLPPRAPLHQSEPDWPCLLEPFPPGVEGALRQTLFLTELLHGNSGALLGCDSFGPLVCFRVGRLLLDDAVAHLTTMQRRPTGQEGRFTRRLRRSGSGDDGERHVSLGLAELLMTAAPINLQLNSGRLPARSFPLKAEINVMSPRGMLHASGMSI